MYKPKLGINIPQQSIIYTGFCLFGILVFLLGGIFPALRTLAELDTQTVTARHRLEEQQTLAPFYEILKESEGKKKSEVLPFPEKSKLPQAKIDTLPLRLSNAVKMSGMSPVSVIPNLNAPIGDTQFLSVNVVFRGDFAYFRKALINLSGLPYVEPIEEITIQRNPDGMEYRLTLRVAIG
jgi:hypothetical protein